MLSKRHSLLCAALISITSIAHADVTVTSPWVRATVEGMEVSGGFLQVKSDQDARLVGAECACADHVELHEMSMKGGVMRMRQLPSLALPAGKQVELEPGEFHLMLMGLKRPLKDGESVDMVLLVKQGKKLLRVPYKAEARSPARH